jgi:VWFA-related protein
MRYTYAVIRALGLLLCSGILSVAKAHILNNPRTPSAAPAFAQQAQSQQSQSGERKPSGSYTLHLETEEVVLNCTVLDGKGQLVNDLTVSNFRVFEDNVPQTIISLQHQDTPVSIGLLVDGSGSMRAKRAAVAAAALDLIRASNPQDETFVINFSDQAYLDQDFTADTAKLQSALVHQGESRGTALYDTVVTAADKLEKSAKHPRQILIVITDGADNASSQTLETTIQRVENMQGPIIYCIGLLFDMEGGGSRAARHALEALSNETGGIAFFPSSLRAIDTVAAEVARDIRNQYTIAYHSVQAAKGRYHEVRMEAHAQKLGKLTVHTRTGYYSNPPSAPPSANNHKN